MVRIPTEVLSDEFNYGFQLGLMRKDVDIGGGLMANNFPEGTLLKALAPVVHAGTVRSLACLRTPGCW